MIESEHFIITGHGRSGTKFLAKQMKLSWMWQIEHEPSAEINLDAIRARFEQRPKRYGEINSYLLYVFRDIHVAKRGVLIRDPLDIAVSMANLGHLVTPVFADHLAASMALIDSAITHGAQPISFKRMTTEVDYLYMTLEAFGVHDVPPDRFDMSKTNSAPKDRVDNFDDFDKYSRGIIERPVRWFREKYYVEMDL